MHCIVPKKVIEDLSILGGSRLFDPPISTSNLVKPDIERFLDYSRLFINEDGCQLAGDVVKLMEQRFAEFHQVSHCVSVSNGFWALVLAIKSLALPEKTEVIMPSLTYRRLADVVAWTGLKPYFCEVDESTLALSPQAVKSAINENTALILGVHPIVNVCDVNGLVTVAEKSGIPLLFDAVESVYETVAGKKVGSFGHAECFSMHASKLINGFEGGYITTDDASLAARLRMMRDCGLDAEGKLRFLGMNAKLSEVHAAMALANLDDLEAQVLRNRHRYYLYKEGLADIPGLNLLTFDETEQTSFKTIVVEVTAAWPLTRAHTIALLNGEGVLCRAYYAPALHAKPMQYPFVPAQLPLTDQLSQQFMLMPCGHMVDDDQLAHLFNLLRFIYDNADLIKGAWQ